MDDFTPIRTKSWIEIIKEEQPKLLLAIKNELASNAHSYRFFEVIMAYLDGRQHINMAMHTTSDIDPARIRGRHEEAADLLEIFEQITKLAFKKEEPDA